jgi:3-deoxy-D-manno-octulosonic-acid transferase
MRRVWELAYSCVAIPLFLVLARLAGIFNRKVRRAIRGRRWLFPRLQVQMAALPPGKRIWFHSSSLGEFEQAKPIIAALKRLAPETRIIVTFFSPSGYEHSRKYPLADVISYLPFDTRTGARHFLDLVQPDVAVMVRYDIWPNHIWELRKRGIPVLIANATMRRHTKRMIPGARSFHRHVYDAINEILTVSQSDIEGFLQFRLRHALLQIVGDTRYDQVSIRSAEARQRNIIARGILDGKRVIVAGSTWPEDDNVIIPAYLQLKQEMADLVLILVPHEPTLTHIEDLERELTGETSFIRFSALNEYSGERVIIVDSVGILLVLYRYAQIAYVGGSFRQGIHNVLEAAVYGVPVVFGPRHRNSQEPLMLAERGGGFIVHDAREIYRTWHNLLDDSSARATAGERASQFVQSHVGATERFLARLAPYLGTQRAEKGR